MPERAASRRAYPLLATAGVAVTLAAQLVLGCRGAAPDGFVLRSLVVSHSYGVAAARGAGSPAVGAAGAALQFASSPTVADVEIDHERRPVVLTTPAPWSWSGRVPRHGALHAGVQLLPAAWQRVRGMEAVVTVHQQRSSEVLQVARWNAAAGKEPAWLDLTSDLERYGGRQVTLEFSVSLRGGPPRWRDTNLVAWGPLAVTAPASAEPRPHPNLIVILVDTLRRDRLTAYGYRRETSPQIGRLLAARGTVMEDAYSQAPWTLPSVVSLMSGRYPGEVLGNDASTFGIPPGVEPLAERLRAGGLTTAAFIGNPTLHVGAGFERGFDTYFAPPADINWMFRHADDLNRHVIPWLTGQQDQPRPFFLYLHYIDPHDPYENPETAGNHSMFEGEYRGRVAGDWVNGFYTGKLKLDDPVGDVAHLSALYDGEIHYVDGRIGEMLAALRPEVLANTLIVLVADHGEELYDHGGWKHGQSLYNEQIHVPMIWRWDGHIAAGKRLAGTVRLLDVAPTLAEAAGVAAAKDWQGASLLAALTRGEPLGKRPAFAEAMSGGPLLAAVVAGGDKLIVYNRDEPFAPADDQQSYLWHFNLARLKSLEAYDLARDPGEHHNLLAAPADPLHPPHPTQPLHPPHPPSVVALPAVLGEVLDHRLDRILPGLRLTAGGVPAGSHLHLELTLAAPPSRWTPHWLAGDDRAALSGARLTVDLADGAPVSRGVRIENPPAVVSLSATLDGSPLAPDRIHVGSGKPYAGGPLSLAVLQTANYPSGLPAAAPAASAGAGSPPSIWVALWIHQGAGGIAQRPHDEEMERRLRALGYIE